MISRAQGGRPRLEADDYFARMLEMVLPREGGLAVFLEAYFDESDRDSGNFCVAGYAFNSVQAKNFARDWRRMLGDIQCFHTTDLLALRREFKHFSRDQSHRMLRRAVEIVNERTAVAVVVMCNRKEFAAVAPKKRGFSNPYPTCCHLCMSLVGQWMDKRSPGTGDVAYFFESGFQYQAEANDLLSLAKSRNGITAGLDKMYRYRSHTFMDKRDCLPLQAADLLAWEWTKLKEDTIDRQESETLKPREVRRSLRSLMNRNPANFLERYLTGTALTRYCEDLANMDLGLDDHGRRRT
jgi:hypothetical protein